MELSVHNLKGEDTGKKVTLSDDIFSIEEPNDHAIYLDVKQYLANQRQGTHKAKERAEIAGSTRKIKKQKGTGTARAGSIKSPVFRGGGRVFGPRPRSYSFKLNKKLKQLARRSALSYKLKEEAIKVVEDFTFDNPRTKDYLSFLNALDVNGKKSLYITSELDRNIYLSGRNIKGAKVTVVDDLSTYDILNADNLIFSENSLSKINNQLAK